MVKNTFWNEASRCGAIVGLIGVLFSLVGMLVPAISFVANLANFVVTIYLTNASLPTNFFVTKENFG